MRSRTPKVLHPVGGKPIIDHVLDACTQAGIRRIVAVVNSRQPELVSHIGGRAEVAYQDEQKGSGHALAQAPPDVLGEGDVLVLNGDGPLIRPETIQLLAAAHRRAGTPATLASVEDPSRTDGRVIVGPGAMLAFGREAYRLAQVQPRDLLSTLLWPGFYRMMVQPRFRALVRSELLKSLFLGRIAAEARLLIPELEAGDLVRSYAGNRAQAVSRSGELVDDIVVRRSGRTVHVLNAVSPGLTCSLPFGRYLAEMCQRRDQ